MSVVRTDRPAPPSPRIRNATISVPRHTGASAPPSAPWPTGPWLPAPWLPTFQRPSTQWTSDAPRDEARPRHLRRHFRRGPLGITRWLTGSAIPTDARDRGAQNPSAPFAAAPADSSAFWLAPVLDALDEGVALTDTRGRIVFVNAALRRFCGCFGTQTFSEGPPACEVARRLESALRPLSLPDHGVAPRAPVILMRQVDPPHRVLERREMVQRAPDGAPLGTATIYRDVTERQTERARNDRFLTSVAHELRTPLTCITGHAGLLDQRLPGLAAGQPDEAGARWARETTSRSLRAIRRQVARMDRLLGDVLDTAQLERGTLALQVEEADVAGLVRAVIEDVAEMAPKHRVDLDAPTVLMARCDATRVEHIVYNLLSNAARFSPAGGAIHVTLRTAGAPGGPNALGHALVLTIGDEGPGVPLEASERIFERYADHDTVVTRDIPGMGIRLAISRALAERHGGSLRLLPASPEHAHGSTFELRLPLS